MSAQILQLAELLSIQHPTVMEVMRTCVADTEKYYKEHRQEYEILGSLSGVVTEEDYECIQWIVLTECLVKYNIAALLDWKCELEDFAYFVKGLAGKRKYKLTFRTAWFDEDASLEEWCATLNAKWQPSGVSFVYLDMNSDSYILLPVLSGQYAIAKELEKHQIAYEILPHSPAYPHFHDCLKKNLQSDSNDYKYFLFDREREKEWNGEVKG